MSRGFLFARSGSLARFDLFLLFMTMSLLSGTAIHVKLNVPRVRLPYLDHLSVNFTLQVEDTVGCFKWYTSRTDIISVITEEGNVCPDRAIISTVPRTGGITLPLPAIVYVEDIKTQEVVRCHVIVDRLVAISIESKTIELHLEEEPSMLTLVGHGSKGDVFSSLDGIPFKWTIEATGQQTDPSSIVRFIPFSESTYHATVGVKPLEAHRLQGSNVLLEGLKTGSAKVIAKVQDSFYKDVAPTEVQIVVVTDLLLYPHEMYFFPENVLPLKLLQMKDKMFTEIDLSYSAIYSVSVVNESVGSFDKKTSMITALNFGETKIVVSYKINTERENQLSSLIYVREPKDNKGNYLIRVYDEFKNIFEHYSYLQKLGQTFNFIPPSCPARCPCPPVSIHFPGITDKEAKLLKPCIGPGKDEL